MEPGGAGQQPLQAAQQQAALQHLYGQAFMHMQQSQLAEAQWRLELSAKLAAIIEKLRERFASSQDVCLCQTWLGADGGEATTANSLEVTLWADPRLAVVLDPLFQELRVKSCQGPVFFRNSMPGKVWRSGAVQIVQNLRILPPTLHPRSQLSEEALERLAEALYIPIYDLGRPAKGQVCVLEVLLSTRATEAMLVADVISFIGNLLTALQLSLANPIQAPVRRSVLCGRRARAPDSDGEDSDAEPGGPPKQPQDPRQPQQQAQQRMGPGEAGEGSVAAGAAGSAAGKAVAGDAAPVTVSGATGPPAAALKAAAAGACCAPAAPTLSEQPTLPASPSPERLARAGEIAAAAAAATAAGGGGAATGAGLAGVVGGDAPNHGSSPAVPRKVRKVMDGAMQRSKSVVSVAALSRGTESEDEENEGQ